MLTSKRQEWILQLIKGPDITQVGNCPGHYTSKSAVFITADEQQISIMPTDVLDLSNPEFLVVHTSEGECAMQWDRISHLDFEEQGIIFASPRSHVRTAPRRMLSFPLGKKVV
jgi:hypothetical protein